jgi:hypothetical protein
LVAALLALVLAGATPTPNISAPPVSFESLYERAKSQAQVPSGPAAYLVTPPGHTFHVLGSQPILASDGAKLGFLISYVGDTHDPEVATAEAEELVAALGFEWYLNGERAALVQARVGFDPRKRVNSTVAFHVGFHSSDGRWRMLPKPPRRAGLPEAIGSGPIELIEYPGFPLDTDGISRVGRVAARWLQATDAGDVGTLKREMSNSLAAETAAGGREWRNTVAARARLVVSGGRRELYRLQTWEGEPSPRGERIWVAYSADVIDVGQCVERIRFVKEAGRWHVSGYALLIPQASRDALRPPPSP